jgi:hypothetical protein
MSFEISLLIDIQSAVWCIWVVAGEKFVVAMNGEIEVATGVVDVFL